MGLHEILEAIRSESEQTASDLVAEATAEAEVLLARARAEADREERRLAGSLDDQARLDQARVLSRSHLDAARTRRAARENLYLGVVESVRGRLAEQRDSDDYARLLGALLDEALVAMPGASVIMVDPRDESTAKRIVEERDLDVLVETVDIPMGGLLLADPGRRVDNTLATRLSRADPQLRFVAGEVIPELRGGRT